ncbi:PepSY-like domain-containing protein [Nonlabens marinus]|uniref:Putative beta-lactamase-inhibitor-like PepSY-like domain-containing protein n=1 Tax=Nonlabens marinus S1-08 TaxID=1454201 RepID=W8VRM1_9FLAO|nr:PepSY-like domain-containing protein [Nonlabens marinus]BAO56359.1 hypothetical protein NMS_2350 [Nonlabens marinus S1-08]
MKNIASLFILILVIGTASCQDSKDKKAPQSVVANFQAKYPGETDPDWHLDSNGLWEANFKINGERYRADFEPNGLWVETENSIKKSELPEAIKLAIEKDYKDLKITEVERVQHYSKGWFYDVEFKQEGKKMDVEYREDGTSL